MLKFLAILLVSIIITVDCAQRVHHQRSSSQLQSSSNVYRYEAIHLLEEPAIGTLIIDLANKLGLNLDTSEYKFRFYSPQSVVSNYFLIDQLTGHVKTQRTIDREYLCETKICGQCLTSNCTLTLEIVATIPFNAKNSNNSESNNLPKQKFVSFDVIIEDKNEFAPQFSQSMLVLNISEAAPLNFQIPIEGAIDRDSQFTQISYSLAPILSKTTNGDEDELDRYERELKKLNSKIKLLTSPFSNQLNLVLTEPFDYEMEKEYSFKILATDNGRPALVGECVVKLNIIDVNDNLPIFDRQEYEYRVDEGVAPGTRLVRVHASDKDDGLNGLVKYSFTEQVVPTSSQQLLSPISSSDSITKLFHIDETTGWISSNTYLDYEYQPIYRLVVKAQDQGVNSMPVYSSVIIHLNDLNDNAPTINLTVADDFYKYHDDQLFISEWTQPGTFLAQIIANDADSGPNGRVDIELQEQIEGKDELINSNTFFIEHLFNNFYSLILKQVIDREVKSEYNLVIKANDYGRPPLSTSKSLKVIIVDENDNQPKFVYSNPEEQFYKFTIYEVDNETMSKNNSIWKNLGRISCTDADDDENGRVSYHLTLDENSEALFKIDETTGDLVVLQSKIDREQHSSFEFKVICEDNGEKKRLSSTSLVKILVMDLNDNKPIFEQKQYKVNVEENTQLYTKIAKFTAFDSDEPLTTNSRLSYKILPTNTSTLKATDVFGINKDNGELYLIQKLDYETEKSYAFYVVATDHGTPQQHSDRVTVHVNVLDVNDNKPTIDWPTDDTLPLVFNLDRLFESYIASNKPKSELFKVKASDADSNENSMLEFTVEKQQKLDFDNDDPTQFRTNIHLFECDLRDGTINGLFFKRFKASATKHRQQQDVQQASIEEIVGLYYLEIRIQDLAKLNPLHSYAKIFLALNTNSTQLEQDIQLLSKFLNQTREHEDMDESEAANENVDVKIMSLKKYVHNALNIKTKLSDYDDNGELNTEDGNRESVSFLLDSLFSFSKSSNKNIELLFGANYKFILLVISITVIILLFVIISVSVVVCYRRQKTILRTQKKKHVTDRKKSSGGKPPATEIININDNLLSSLIDVASRSSSEDNKINNLSSTIDNNNTTATTGLQSVETLKRLNKLRATVNDFDLNISSEDQTALLLYSNSPASSSSSTTSNRQIIQASSASTASSTTSTNQTNLSLLQKKFLSSIENIDESSFTSTNNKDKFNTLRTFKNVQSLTTTPRKILKNYIDSEDPPNLTQTNEIIPNSSYQHKYYTLPINRLSQHADDPYGTTTNGTFKDSPKVLVSFNSDNNHSSHQVPTTVVNTTISESNEETPDYDVLNRNKFCQQHQTNSNDIPDYFFKNKKELKKLVYKNNMIDCKRLEIADETD